MTLAIGDSEFVEIITFLVLDNEKRAKDTNPRNSQRGVCRDKKKRRAHPG